MRAFTRTAQRAMAPAYMRSPRGSLATSRAETRLAGSGFLSSTKVPEISDAAAAMEEQRREKNRFIH